MTSRHHRMVMAALFILLGLFFAWAAWGQDEVLEPNATSAETNSDCTTSNAHTRLSDNSNSTLCDGGDGSSAESYIIRLDFPTPTSAPSTGTDDQTFQCVFKKSSAAGNGDPTIQMDLYCNDTSIESGSPQTVSSTIPVEFSESVTFGGTCTSDGSDVEVHIDVTRAGGSPAGRRSADSIDCDWDVTFAPTGDDMMIIDGGPHETIRPTRIVRVAR